mmetsp:Transcript_40399/g.79651  ORF Transcript_40399/g.79651 Transcript_40399/m.79651 type:complete len:109 (+) Transcript_40399:88-414(+)
MKSSLPAGRPQTSLRAPPVSPLQQLLQRPRPRVPRQPNREKEKEKVRERGGGGDGEKEGKGSRGGLRKKRNGQEETIHTEDVIEIRYAGRTKYMGRHGPRHCMYASVV